MEERAAMLPPAPPGVGEIVAGKYRIDRVLGRGGMGVVVEAQHLQLEHPVAIKFLLSEAAAFPGAVARFVREARAAARIRSEHVARVLDVDTLPSGLPFMVMEYLQGIDLHQLVRARGPLPVDEAIDYVLQACEPLAEAHAAGIVHRDLKPGNLFLTTRPDGSPLVKLLDFGIAKAPEAQTWAEGSLTVTRGMLGSPLYMSPEHLRDTSAVDARTDIWSLGVILHELLTTRFPFEAASQAALGAMIAAAPAILLRAHWPDAPVELEAVILRCLEKDPGARFQTVGELAVALRPFAAERSRASLERIASLSSLSSTGATQLASPALRAQIDPRTPSGSSRAGIEARASIESSRGASGRIVPVSFRGPEVRESGSSLPRSRDAAPSSARAAVPSSARDAVSSLSRSAPSAPASSQLRTVAKPPTENFRRQHEELATLGSEILKIVSGPEADVVARASEVRRLLARFAGKLNVHASMENEALYPRLLAHRDEAVREKAQELFREVEGLYGAFHTFVKRWPTTAAIEEGPAAFAKDARKVLKTLWVRMCRENDELYPLVDESD